MMWVLCRSPIGRTFWAHVGSADDCAKLRAQGVTFPKMSQAEYTAALLEMPELYLSEVR